jgi:hypothetical protein
VEAGPGSRLHAAMASSNSCASSHCLRSTHSCRSSAMCAGRTAEADAPDPPPLPHHGAQLGPVLHGYSPMRASRKPIRVAARPPPGGTRRARPPRRPGRRSSSDQLRMASELRAHLADPVAQRDHVAEPLPGELLQVL